MRNPIRQFVRISTKHFPLQAPIYEFGSLQVTGAPEENLRGLFGNLEYIGADMRSGKGVDVVLDLHDIDLPDSVAACVVCMDTLEHVEYPRKAMEEVWRILKPGGFAIVSSVFDFPIHGYPNDYWRFTPEGFKSLLRHFDYSFVGSYGLSEVSPQTVVGLGFKGEKPDMKSFMKDYQNWRTWNNALMEEAEKS